MSHVKRRYFKLTGLLKEIAKTWKDTEWKQNREALKAFCESVGTNDMMVAGKRIVAIKDVGKDISGTKPSKEFPGFWEPNLRTKAGKALKAEMVSLEEPKCDPLWSVIAVAYPWFVDGWMVYPGIACYGEIFIVSIPKEVEYEPHPEMVELKEWEFLKLKDDYQAAQSKAETAA